jgi:hypothetical protein
MRQLRQERHLKISYKVKLHSSAILTKGVSCNPNVIIRVSCNQVNETLFQTIVHDCGIDGVKVVCDLSTGSCVDLFAEDGMVDFVQQLDESVSSSGNVRFKTNTTHEHLPERQHNCFLVVQQRRISETVLWFLVTVAANHFALHLDLTGGCKLNFPSSKNLPLRYGIGSLCSPPACRSRHLRPTERICFGPCRPSLEVCS